MKKTLTIMGLAVATLAGAQAQVVVNALNTAFTQNFTSMGNSSSATLPTGFRVNTSANWNTGNTSTTLAYGTTGTGAVTGTSGGGIVNWGNGTTATSTDRSLGFLNTGSFTTPNSILYAFTNSTGATITGLTLSWDFEKSRSGSRAFAWTFFHGSNATSVSTSATAGDQAYAADANNTVISNPPLVTSKSFTLSGLSISDSSTYYLAWTLTGNGGSTNGQGLSLDNFSLTAVPEPTAWVLIGLGVGFMLWNVRRRRSQRA